MLDFVIYIKLLLIGALLMETYFNVILNDGLYINHFIDG